MKRCFALFLTLVLLLLSLSSCMPALLPDEEETTETGNTEDFFYGAAGSETADPTEEDDFPYPTILDEKQKLSWENLNSYLIKSNDLTLEERRELCVSFFRYSKTALWICGNDFEYIRNKRGSKDHMDKGQIYGGLPYIGNATGNVYRLMDYMDQETGVVDITELSRSPLLFGNMCSLGPYWAWSKVVNSANYTWTHGMVQSKGFLRVGPYTYDDSIPDFNGDVDTESICKDNGEQIMFQSYAQMLPADGFIASHSTNGHAMMCSSVPVVVYKANGEIDGDESYLYILDQHQAWVTATSAAGDTYLHKNYVDKKFTFRSLFKNYYIPFTFGELIGTDPIEDTVCTYSYSGSTITVEQLQNSSVTANYGISDILAFVKDAQGNQVMFRANRATAANRLTMAFKGTIHRSTFLPYLDGTHTVEVAAQLSTGERIILFSGPLLP